MKNNITKSSIISRLNNNWEATITISLPLAVLDKLAKKAARRGFKPLHFAKMKLQEFAEAKEAK